MDDTTSGSEPTTTPTGTQPDGAPAALPTSAAVRQLEPVHVARLAERHGWRPEQFGESVLGTPLIAWWPTSHHPTRLVWAAIHGEESATLQLVHHALRTVHADDSCAVVVPVLNPDGVLYGTRQNANGVDLNRNFPASTWAPDPSPTFWPFTLVRSGEHRTQLSSPGGAPASEPEVQAIGALFERLAPVEVVDLHGPLECVIATTEAGMPLARSLAEPARLPVVSQLANPTPGDSAQWTVEQGSIAVTYEIEHAPLPHLWHRHHESLVRMLVAHRDGERG